MIPVVMLAINTGELRLPGTLLCLTKARPSFEHFPVIYLMTVALRAAILNFQGVHTRLILLSPMIDGTQLALQTLSLLINICATATIALKAWCVRIRINRVFVKHLLTAP
jgi:hypothetical protein